MADSVSFPAPDVIRVGLHSGQQYSDYAECLHLWTEAETLGFDVISLFDHLRPPIGGPHGPCFEAFTLLSALAAQVPRIRCALMVSPVTWRHPAVSAAAAATIDHVSAGRLEFGLGVGGADLGYEQFGIGFPPFTERLARLDESCQVHRALWSGEAANVEGRFYRLKDAVLSPPPRQPRLPLILGGRGEGVLTLAARNADVWNTLAGSRERYQHDVARLEAACQAADRPVEVVRRSITFRAVLRVDERAAVAAAEELFTAMPQGSPDRGEFLVVGTSRRCAEVLQGFVEDGASDLILASRPPLDRETIRRFAHEVAPTLKGRGCRG